MSSRNVLFRMARRQVWRNKLRSLLIIALIAFPVAAVTMGEVLYRSSPLSTRQNVEQRLGAADAELTSYSNGAPVHQSTDGLSSAPVSQVANTPGDAPTTPPNNLSLAQLHTVLPNATIAPELNDSVLVKTPLGAVQAELHGVDLSNPGLRPAFTLVSGQWPTTGDNQAAVIDDTLAATTQVKVGDELTLRHPDATVTVAAIVHSKYGVYRYLAITPARYASLGANSDVSSWLVVRSGGVQWTDVLALNKIGVTVYSRAVLFHPPPKSEVPAVMDFGGGNNVTKTALVTIGVAVGMAILQLALLAGPAFAVSARRRQRDLALIAAAGGDRPVLRRTLLTEGLVLGVLAAIFGWLFGFGFALLYRHTQGGVLGPIRIRPWELLGIGALGVLAALAGAMLPAHWASRLDVVAALAGRRGATKAPWRATVLGVVAIAIGLVVGFIGTNNGSVLLILPGFALCELGILALTPGILSLAGSVAPKLPVALRIALRDSSRNRTAAVPALAAVLAATTASVSIAIFAASLSAKNRLAYQPQLPRDFAVVDMYRPDSDIAAAVTQDLKRYLPTSRVDVISINSCDNDNCTFGSVARPEANVCHPSTMSRTDPRCDSARFTLGGYDQLVLRPDQLAAVSNQVSAADQQAFADGKVLLRSKFDLSGPGHVTIDLPDQKNPDVSHHMVLPAAVLSEPSDYQFTAVLPASVAKRLHYNVKPGFALARLTEPPTSKQEEQLTGELANYDLGAQIEHGYRDQYRTAILAALIAAIVIAMGATALSTALAVVDSRPDLATLWAIGAGPGVRRRLSVARSAVVALIGVLLGTVIGFIPPLIVIINERRRAHHVAVTQGDFAVAHPFTVPWWPNVIGTALLIPIAAMLIAGLMTRARPPKPSTAG